MLSRFIDECAAVLFDFDGVLADSEPCFYETYNRAFTKRGHAIDKNEYWEYWTGRGEGAWGEIRRHGLPFTEEDVRAILAERREIYSALCREGAVALIPGMMNALASLVRGGRPCAIASNSFEDDIRAVLTAGGRTAAAEIAPGISVPPCPIIGRKKGLRTKPAPDIFVYAAGLLQVEPAGCLVIEDANKGLEAAKKTGMACAIVRTPYNQRADFSAADAVLESHEAFVRSVQQWAAGKD